MKGMTDRQIKLINGALEWLYENFFKQRDTVQKTAAEYRLKVWFDGREYDITEAPLHEQIGV